MAAPAPPAPTSALISGWWTSCISATRLTPARWTAPGGTSSLTIIRSRVTWPPPRRRPRPPDLPRRPRAPHRPGPHRLPRLPGRPRQHRRPRPLPRPAARPPRLLRRLAQHQHQHQHQRQPAPRAAAPAPRRSRRGSGAPARRGRPDGRQHGRQPRRADRYQRPRHPGQAAGRQPHRDQQPPGPRPGRQGVIHPPDRLCRRARAGRGPGDERLLHRGRRQAGADPARRDRPGAGHRHRQARRVAPAPGAEHQVRSAHGLPPVLDRLRGHRPQGPHRQAHRRRLRRDHDQPDEPRHDRDRALGAAADAGPGLHRRRRRDGVPGRLPGRLGRVAGPDGDQQDRDADLDL